jgi:hypothetical protein
MIISNLIEMLLQVNAALNDELTHLFASSHAIRMALLSRTGDVEKHLIDECLALEEYCTNRRKVVAHYHKDNADLIAKVTKNLNIACLSFLLAFYADSL